MSRKDVLIVSFILLSLPIWVNGQSHFFIQNKGQWPDKVLFDAKLPGSHVFVEKDRLTFVLTDQEDVQRGHDLMHLRNPYIHDPEVLMVDHFAYQLIFTGSGTMGSEGQEPTPYYENYFRGKTPDKWVGGAPSFRKVRLNGLYRGIDMVLYFKDGTLKYDLQVTDPESVSQIGWRYSGPQEANIQSDGHIEMDCGFTLVRENPPIAYSKDGSGIGIQYRSENGNFGFHFNEIPEGEFVIDPQFIFSSFSGSTSDNFGFTATYDHNGNTYGGGITYGTGYPTTTGAYQTNYGAGQYDATISKFSADGTTLLFSTYLGGGNQDQPHSLVVDSQNRLLVFGVTGSSNFPVTPTAFDTTFNGGPFATIGITTYQNGADMFVARFSTDGKNLLHSTFIGGSGNDGVNNSILPNYGDFYRGEIVVDPQDNIYIASCTYSNDFPTINGQQPNAGGSISDMDGVIVKFSTNLDQILWSTYHGGSSDEAAFSLKEDAGKLFVTGVTEGGTFPMSSGGYQSSFQGLPTDAFITRFNAGTGVIEASSFVGTAGEDLGFFVEVDPFGDVYLFGQTKGNFPVSPGVWNIPGSHQFIQKMDRGLTTRQLSTTFGDTLGGNSFNIAPSAFMVDSCRNIYLSGWGGVVNYQGSTQGMYVTSDAYQSQTTGSDFYFMVLDGSWAFPEYATFFGGASNEHVDGGTSRFSRDGTIHQAICAGCGQRSFPTFPPNVYAPTNGSQNCNLACVKIHFDYSSPEINVKLEPDTSCVPYTLNLQDQSSNVDLYYWDFGDGTRDTSLFPNKVFTNTGTYTITMIGVDTLCNRYDTASVVLYLISDSPQAGFTVDQDTCGPPYSTTFTSQASSGSQVFWDFGDGTTDTVPDPEKSFPGPGTYTVTQVVTSILCGTTDTSQQTLTFYPSPTSPEIKMELQPCSSPSDVQFTGLGGSYHYYYWSLGDGDLDTGSTIQHSYSGPGIYQVTLTVVDTNCGVTFSVSKSIEVMAEFDPDRIFPNVFTPNGDGINDLFTFLEPELASRFGNYSIHIFNRWGMEVFESNHLHTSPWDGKLDRLDVPEGVYFWVLKLKDPCEGTDEYHGIVHLNR